MMVSPGPDSPDPGSGFVPPELDSMDQPDGMDIDGHAAGATGVLSAVSSLPTGLFRRVVVQAVAAMVFFVGGIVILLMLKATQSLLMFILAGWSIWTAISIVLDYQAGRILEGALVCVSVQYHRAGNRTRLVFRTANEETPEYYEFFLPGRKSRTFTPNMIYLIYVRASAPQILLAYQAL